MKRQVSFRLPEALVQHLSERAKEEELSITDLVERCLGERLGLHDDEMHFVEQEVKRQVSPLKEKIENLETTIRTLELALRSIVGQIESRALEDARRLVGDIPRLSQADYHQGLSRSALTRRLRCDKESLAKRKGDEADLVRFTRERDPDQIGWIYRGSRYFPESRFGGIDADVDVSSDAESQDEE